MKNTKYSIGEQVFFCKREDDVSFSIHLAKIISLYPMLDCDLIYDIVYEDCVIKEEINDEESICEMCLIKVPHSISEDKLFKTQYEAIEFCFLMLNME